MVLRPINETKPAGLSARPSMRRWRVGRHDHPADRPERQARELEVRPGERDADDGDGQENGDDEMAEGQPPAGQDQPYDISDNAERSGADVLLPGIFGARHRLLAER